MLSLEHIREHYPQDMRMFPRFILREYLQHKILEILYDSPYAPSLHFMGGTCLRIIHGNQRFSEDLDFENVGLQENDFIDVSALIVKALEREGYRAEMKTIMRGAWHCHIRFPKLLYETGLSGYEREKIKIQIDMENQQYDYAPERIILNRFDLFTAVLTVPLPLLLSQKYAAALKRPRLMGRDLFDILFLKGKGVAPDWNYLKKKLKIENSDQLRSALLARVDKADIKAAATDLKPFLFKSEAINRVFHFREYIRQTEDL